MVGQYAKATAIENDRAPHFALGTLQLDDYLPHAGHGILVLEYFPEIYFYRPEDVQKRPGAAAGLIENVINFGPGSFHIFSGRLLSKRITGVHGNHRI